MIRASKYLSAPQSNLDHRKLPKIGRGEMSSEHSTADAVPLFDFPSASQPDISRPIHLMCLNVVRANQKDVYYQSYILEHLEALVQNILGTCSYESTLI